jgi:hypothetical protein
MSKLKVIVGVLALLSLLFGQCSCPYSGNNPSGSFGSKDHSNYYWYDTVNLLGEWQTTDAKWNFAQDGKLTINANGKEQKGLWIEAEGAMEVVIDDELTVFAIEVLSETRLKFSTGSRELILER